MKRPLRILLYVLVTLLFLVLGIQFPEVRRTMGFWGGYIGASILRVFE